jgi:predicted RNA binding protein YcfA (HicA-like mRNA interferase family)
VKRLALTRHLERTGCVLVREGANHSLWIGPDKRLSTVPRHREINVFLARKICRDLGFAES